MEPLPPDSRVPVEVVNGTVPTGPSQSCVSNPRTRNRKGVQTKKSQKEKQTFQKTYPLNRKDINCPICLSIFIEPVTFPCEHSLCMECFRTHVRETSLYCPFCRCRLSVWSRRANKRNSLINTEFWERIKHHYPVEVECRLAGNDSQIGEYESSDDVLNKIDGTLVEPGEIRKEFDAMLTQYKQEVETDRKKELEATHKYLQQLQETEGPPVEIQIESDYELAKRLQQEEEKAQQRFMRQRRGELRETSGFVSNSINLNQPSCSKRLSVASSFFQPSPKRICLDSESISSNQHNSHGTTARNGSITPDSNSIDNEFNQHFRPIACAPRKPQKRNPDGSFQQAVLVKTLVTKRSLMDEFVASEQKDDSHEQDEIDSDSEYTIHEENAASPKIAVFGKYIAKKKRDATVGHEASTSGLFAEIETNRTENSDQSFLSSIHASSFCQPLNTNSLHMDMNENCDSDLDRTIYKDPNFSDTVQTGSGSDLMSLDEVLRNPSSSNGTMDSTHFLSALESLARKSLQETEKVKSRHTKLNHIQNEDCSDEIQLGKSMNSTSKDDQIYSVTELVERCREKITPSIVPRLNADSGILYVIPTEEIKQVCQSSSNVRPTSSFDEDMLDPKQNQSASSPEEKFVYPSSHPLISTPGLFEWRTAEAPPNVCDDMSKQLGIGDTGENCSRRVFGFIEDGVSGSERSNSPITVTTESSSAVIFRDPLNSPSRSLDPFFDHLDQIPDEITNMTTELTDPKSDFAWDLVAGFEKSTSPSTVQVGNADLLVQSVNRSTAADQENIIFEALTDDKYLAGTKELFETDISDDTDDIGQLMSTSPETMATGEGHLVTFSEYSIPSMVQEALIPDENQMEELSVEIGGPILPSDSVDDTPYSISEIHDGHNDILSAPSGLDLNQVGPIKSSEHDESSDYIGLDSSCYLQSPNLGSVSELCTEGGDHSLFAEISSPSTSRHELLTTATLNSPQNSPKQKLQHIVPGVSSITASIISSSVASKNSLSSDEIENKQQEETDRKIALRMHKILNNRNFVESNYQTRQKSGKIDQRNFGNGRPDKTMNKKNKATISNRVTPSTSKSKVRSTAANENNRDVETGQENIAMGLTKTPLRTKPKLRLRRSDNNGAVIDETPVTKTMETRDASIKKSKPTEPASTPSRSHPSHSHSARSKDIKNISTALQVLVKSTRLSVCITKLTLDVISLYTGKREMTRLSQLNTERQTLLGINHLRNIQQSTSPIHKNVPSSNSILSTATLPRKSSRRKCSTSASVMIETKLNTITTPSLLNVAVNNMV